MEPQASQGMLVAEGDCGTTSLLVPSPQSEAVTHELEELTLQPTQSLPPLNERKNVLQLRLQQRRTREQLVDQGIMPPLKSPAAFHGQIRSLERARTENFLKHKIRSRPERAELVRMHILQVTTAAPSKPGPTLVKQSQQKPPSEKSRSKKGKEPKPRVKKLKYHQYVPPDQKQEASEAPMDSSYARLLQQQQLFLQLQILSQQQQHYNYQTILPAPLKPVAEGQSSSAGSLPTSIVVSLPTAPPPPPLPSAPARPNNSLSNRKPGVLPANLEDMK
eukprot:superscaffoldBa00005545_g20478